jgi:catechol 2,3-dioxygenase
MAYKLISQLHHTELFTAAPDRSVAFFTETLGMTEVARKGQSVYLRAWGEWYHSSLKITEAAGPGLGHMAWRTDDAEALDVTVRNLKSAGVDGRWIDGDVGHGAAFQFWTPGGHLAEVTWEAERYLAPPELASTFPNRPQRQVERGAPVRRIDHVTVATANLRDDVALFRDHLGFRFMEGTLAPPPAPADICVFAALTSGPQNHDLGVLAERPNDPTYKPGRLHHLCYYYDTRDELLRSLDILAEQGFKLEAGPTKHGIGELFFCYVFEPGGTLVELQTGGYWNYVPDWETVFWPEGGIDGANTAWNGNQFAGYGLSSIPEGLERLENSTAPTQQYTAKERQADLA